MIAIKQSKRFNVKGLGPVNSITTFHSSFNDHTMHNKQKQAI